MNAPRHRLETGLEWALFSSRWTLAPFYVGMVLALVAILVIFIRELVQGLWQVPTYGAEEVILFALSLINLSLAGNLLLVVIFAGYENFVSRIHLGDHEDRPTWMGAIDFSNLKIKLIASIVAISAISLLRAFLSLGESGVRPDAVRIGWMVAIHLTFVTSGVLLAAMDWITSRTKGIHASPRP